MKSSIAVKFPENFEARVTFTGTGTLDFQSFRVIIEPSTFKLEVESAGKLTTLNGTHGGTINLRHIDSRLYVGDGTKWTDSVYSPEIVTPSKVEVIGDLDVTDLTATEIFDVYAEPLSSTPERVALVAPWDVFVDQTYGVTVIDSEYAMAGDSIAEIPEAGLSLHTLPMDMRNDFCLAFSLAVDVADPNTTVVEQNNFKVRLSGSTFSVTIGVDTATIQVVKSDNYSVVIDRFGSQVSLNVNGEETRFNAPATLGKADKAIWFGEGEFEGKFLRLAFIARTVLKGRQPNGSRPVNIPVITHSNIPGDINRKWMRVADSAMLTHTGEEGSSLSIGLRVLKDGDFSLFKDVLEVVGGKLVCSGQELAEVELNTDIRFSVYFGEGLTVTVEGKSATVNVNTIQGDWPGSYAEVFSFAAFPGDVLSYPPTALSGQLTILSNLPGNIQRVLYSREGFESSSFLAYVDRETPGGPWVLLISYVGAMGRVIYMEDVMSDEIVTDTYTNDESLYPVIPSGLNLTLSQIMVKNENPQWIGAVGNPVILNNRPLVGGIIGREGVDAYSEARGVFKLYGPEAGWYSGSSGASISNNRAFGLMTAIGNRGLCGGANVCGTGACLAITASANPCHYDYVNLKQVFVRAALGAIYLQDTSEDSADEILPDLGPRTAHAEDGDVSLYGLVPGSANALIQAVGPVGGIVPEDNVGWIKVSNATNEMFIAKRPLAFGANIPEEKELNIDGRVFSVRSLRSDEWRDIMYRLSALNAGSDERIGSLRQFNSDYIGLTKDGVPAISAIEGGRAFRGINEELTEEQLSQVEPAAIGWRPALVLEYSDTSERETDQVLPDLGPALPFKSSGGVDFYGLVSGNSQAMSSLAGMTSGTVEWMYCGWIKVRIDGKLLYIAKRPMRVAVGHAPGVPNKVVTIDGRRYRLRTLDYDWPNKYTSAGKTDPVEYYGSEWNRIMYRLASRSGNSAEGIPFGEFLRFEDAELCFGSYTSDGSYSLIRNSIARYALRGGSGGNWSATIGINPKAIGWRPVLESLED